MQGQPITYPVGALIRVGQICTVRGGPPGLLPINPATWYAWVKKGRAPQGRKIGENTVVWPIEEVLALANPEKVAA